jgi:hypothetical protein
MLILFFNILRFIDVGNAANILEVNAASIIRIEVIVVKWASVS